MFQYLVMYVPITNIEWKMVDKPLGGWVNIVNCKYFTENVLHNCCYKENKNIQYKQ